MTSRFDNMDIDFPCGHCERQFPVKLGKLTKGAEIKCPHCCTVNLIADDNWQVMKRSLERFPKKFP